MAITRAQQVKQMLRDGGRIGFRVGSGEGKDFSGRDYGGGGGPDKPGRDRPGPDPERDNQKLGLSPGESRARFGTPKYAGLNLKDATDRNNKDQEAKKIADAAAAEFKKNLKIKEQQEKERKQRILDEQRRKQQEQLGILGRSTTTRFGNPNITGKFFGEDTSKFKNIETLKSLGAIEEDDEDDAATAKAIGEQNAIEKFLGNFKPPSVALVEGILSKIPGRSLDEMYDQYIKDKTGFKFKEYAGDKGRKLFKQDVLAGKISSKGGPMGGFGRDEMGNTFGPGGDGPDNQIIPQVVPTTTGSTTTTPQVVDNRTELEKLLDARGDAFRFFADGGMADDDDPVGGIMDLESGRQMYFLGKLVKKATKTIKKIAKSPIGKAAILGGLAYFGGGGGLPKLLSGKGLGGFSAKTFFSKSNPLLFTGKKLSLGKLAALSAASPFLFPAKQEEEDEEQYLGPSIDIPAIRRDPYGAMGRAYRFAADGGIMRMGYQDGSKEPVAKKTMPLIDMDGMEKDYRETGGFVEMGRMERADDVPARLSKNEFVFTADAVRNAGDGSVDKGAEVMYNMMKNLESGGEVSEESQGLEGARKMFQTSQRLGEVV